MFNKFWADIFKKYNSWDKEKSLKLSERKKYDYLQCSENQIGTRFLTGNTGRKKAKSCLQSDKEQ